MQSFSRPRHGVAAIFTLLLSSSAFAQVAAPPPPSRPEHQEGPQTGGGAVAHEEEMGEEIYVIADRVRGGVEGDIQPEIQMSAGEVRALGASSLQEVLDTLAPQLASGGGRGGEPPVVLLNGKRIAGFREIRSIPPEAIERVDILPEDVSLTYGYPATQKVINFVLRQRFRALTTEIEGGMPTAGGRGEIELDANVVNIRGDNRLVVDMEYTQRGMILERERDIVSRASGSLSGNVLPAAGASEIDPALSALAGTPVTVAGVPASAAAGAPALTDFVPTANKASLSDQGSYRSLTSRTREFQGGVSLSRPLGSMQATYSANIDVTDTLGLQGLPSANLLLPASNPFSPFGTDVTLSRLSDSNGALERNGNDWSGRFATAITGRLGSYNLSINASWEHHEATTLTDRGLDLSVVSAGILAGDPALNPFGAGILAGPLMQDRAASNDEYALIESVLSGEVAQLPAGGIRSTLKLGFNWRDISSWSLRSGVQQQTDLSRSTGNGQLSIDIPLTSRRNEVLAAIGDVSLNLNVAASQLSDFGTLTTLGVGGRWSPIEILDLSASITREEGAPGIAQLGNPNVVTPNVRVYDFIRGETVEISRLDGGNPDLDSDRRRVLKLGASVQPKLGDATTLTLLANYTDSRVDDPIASFPTATAELEAAFPQRFLRDSDGRLLMIDNRPVNFEEAHTREMRWGFNLMQKIKPSAKERAVQEAQRAEFQKRREAYEAERQKAIAEGRTPPPPRMPGQQQSIFGGAPGGPGGPPPGAVPGGPGGPPRGAPRNMGNPNEGRLMFSLFHTWRFQNTILIREGVPELDLLNGSATGSSGGVSRHELEGRLMLSKNGFGGHVALNWSSGTNVLVDPQGPLSADDLYFSSLGKVNLRLFADLSQRRGLVQQYPFFRASRVSLGVDNLFDARRTVTNRAGDVPVAYQPDLLDPVGRRIELSFRKLFF